jgi:hypothetical protein
MGEIQQKDRYSESFLDKQVGIPIPTALVPGFGYGNPTYEAFIPRTY